MTDLEQVREYFKDDKFATKTTGIEISDAGKGYAKVKLKLDERHYNAAGGVMGGVLFTMADFAFAIASNFKGPLCVTLESSICYLNSVKGSTLYAECRALKDGSRTNFFEIDITDDLGTAVAKVTANGYKILKK